MQGEAKLEQRVVETAEKLLAKKKSVTALGILTGIGWLSENVVDAWQRGRIPDLSTALPVTPEKLTFALGALQRWVAANNLEGSEIEHVGATRDRAALRVTSGELAGLEPLFRTHWIMPGLSEAKRAQVEARQRKAPDLVVSVALQDWTCADCGGTGDLRFLENEKPHCLDCADLGHLVFLPSGDATLTRRAKKASRLSAVVTKFNRSRKRHERQGILVEEAALRDAEEQCLADEDVRERRRGRDRERRAHEDVEFTARFHTAIVELFPGCPPERARAIAEHAGLRGSGRVGRSAAGRELAERAVFLAVVASIRHLDTEYDDLLMAGVERQAARDRIRPTIDAVLERWRS
ncbi:DUF2293 domain-containing protein [Amycolatopsis keratiniphila]|uniref:DUF2293 domain-containing protein n=1 Tax=Amycolatopsis keratiniphila subsp. keratiniphila TaxID=227715 RepID=A0A1W2LY51_9PSEU|nr:DUF2293 domain-containing protein [Amycolatopsis keratiniphila]ONF71562.1 hypothetical protein AVR91_0212905 [Amycolatopsis keratiniphila subsp. keratiniphila]